MTVSEQVILVDTDDLQIGVADKLAAHQNNQCHRAFSVFVFRTSPTVELLLQQRAKNKYHTPLLWTNTCCSHPRPNEDVIDAGRRRLREELGFDVPLRAVGRFHYIAPFDNGLVENEVDHVLVGIYGQQPIVPCPDEVESYRWITINDLRKELAAEPEKFTPWLAQALTIADHHLSNLMADN